jgi:hypothetical protein
VPAEATDANHHYEKRYHDRLILTGHDRRQRERQLNQDELCMPVDPNASPASSTSASTRRMPRLISRIIGDVA